MVIRRSVVTSLLLQFCALAFIAAPTRAADDEALNKRFKEANAKIDAGDAQGALEIYNEILEAKPEAANAWVTRAVAKWRLQDKSGARADFAQAIRLDPDNAAVYHWRGRFRYAEQDYQGSLADFNQAIKLVEATVAGFKSVPFEVPMMKELRALSAELYGMRGEVNSELGETTDAIRDLDRAIQLRPDFPSAIFIRGKMHENSGDATAAIADYTRVIELAPKTAEAWQRRAWLRFYARDWDAAMGDGGKAQELAPTDPLAMRVVGFAKFAKADYAGAVETLAQAADAEPGANAAYALFVRHYAMLRTGGGADKRLATTWTSWQDESWIQALAKYITGQLSEDELEAVAKDTADDAELAARACEMHFYIGLARKQAGDKSTARLRFQSALGTNQKLFIEDALSSAELKRL